MMKWSCLLSSPKDNLCSNSSRTLKVSTSNWARRKCLWSLAKRLIFKRCFDPNLLMKNLMLCDVFTGAKHVREINQVKMQTIRTLLLWSHRITLCISKCSSRRSCVKRLIRLKAWLLLMNHTRSSNLTLSP